MWFSSSSTTVRNFFEPAALPSSWTQVRSCDEDALSAVLCKRSPGGSTCDLGISDDKMHWIMHDDESGNCTDDGLPALT